VADVELLLDALVSAESDAARIAFVGRAHIVKTEAVVKVCANFDRLREF